MYVLVYLMKKVVLIKVLRSGEKSTKFSDSLEKTKRLKHI
jgi:hypothetical protein